MNDHPRKTDNFFKANQDLRSIFSKLKLLTELDVKIAPFLGPTIKKSCQVANLIDSKLVLLVANGSIATELRFRIPELLNKFRQDGLLKNIKEIQLKVRPYTVPDKTAQTPQAMPLLSNQTASIIQEIAISITDPKLKEALLRISKHTKESEID